jgi:RHS repeat-associated protein
MDLMRLGWVLRGAAAALAAMASAVGMAGTVTYYHNDLAGSPVVATNELGSVVWRESYRPYGERTVNSAAASGNKVWFTSRRQNAETGLVYMGARYYDPVVGRFISTDPSGFDEQSVHSFNRYAYASNNPYKYVDPDGNVPILIPLIVHGARILAQRALTFALTRGAQASVTAAEIGAGEALGAGGVTAGAVMAERAAARAADALAGAAGPVAGGGAKLENLGSQEVARIQNAADRTETSISVVGSRAKGTPGPTSDWDYVVPEGTRNRTIHSLKSSLPEGPRGLGEPRNQDIFKGTVDPNEPHITFTPR